MESTVIIEEVNEEAPKEPKRKRESPSQFEERMKKFRRVYTQIDKMRVKWDFMYMMLSGKDETEKMVFMTSLLNTMKDTYRQSQHENGLNLREIETLQKGIDAKDPNGLDALWFFSFHIMNSVTDWVMHGDKVTGKRPPNIGNRDMFRYFTECQTFTNICNSFLDNKLDFKAFAIAMRSEYAMTVGFVNMEQYARELLDKEEAGVTLTENGHVPQSVL
jgi:hypothetical protein